jgi:hypothetical protein
MLSSIRVPCGSLQNYRIDSLGVGESNGRVQSQVGDRDTIDSVLEHSVSLKNYAAVLTLLWIEDPPKVDDSDELLDEMDPEAFTLRRTRWPR